MEFKGRALKCYNKYNQMGVPSITLVSIMEKLIKGDPSGNNKYLDWMVDRNVFEGGVTIEGTLDCVKYFHENTQKFGCGDLYQYKTFEDLLKDYEDAKKNLTKKEKKELIDSTTTILFEDDDYLIVIPESWEASKYWGCETKWCTTMKEYPDHFTRYTTDGMLFYVIDKLRQRKEHPLSKLAIHITNGGRCCVYNRPDSNLGDCRHLFPSEIVDAVYQYYNNTAFKIDDIIGILKNIISSKYKLKTNSDGDVIVYLPYRPIPTYRVRLKIVKTSNKTFEVDFDLLDKHSKSQLSNTIDFNENKIFRLSKQLKLEGYDKLVENIRLDINAIFKDFNRISKPIPMYRLFKSEISRINTNNKSWTINIMNQGVLSELGKEFGKTSSELSDNYYKYELKLKHKGKSIYSNKDFNVSIEYSPEFRCWDIECNTYDDYVYECEECSFHIQCDDKKDISYDINDHINSIVTRCIKHYKQNTQKVIEELSIPSDYIGCTATSGYYTDNNVLKLNRRVYNMIVELLKDRNHSEHDMATLTRLINVLN